MMIVSVAMPETVINDIDKLKNRGFAISRSDYIRTAVIARWREDNEFFV